MRYVLDSSVALKWFLQEIDSPIALQLRDDLIQGVHEFLAPDIYPVEMAHSITRAERQIRITQAEGRSHFRTMLATLPTIHSCLPLLPRAYVISSQARIGVYDCLYVALAEQEGCKVVTADEKLKRNLPSSPIVLPSTFP